jgi:hypothetical protein
MVKKKAEKQSKDACLELIVDKGRVAWPINLPRVIPEKEGSKRQTFICNDLRDSKGRQAGSVALTSSGKTVRLDIDSATAPGQYSGTLHFEGNIEKNFVLHVMENCDVQFKPSALVVFGKPGEQIMKQIAVANNGNIPVILQKRAIVGLNEKDEVPHAFLKSFRDPSVKTADQLIDKVTSIMRKQSVNHLIVTFTADTLTIKPGEIKVIDLTMFLPDDLRKDRPYRTHVNICERSFQITIYCID